MGSSPCSEEALPLPSSQNEPQGKALTPKDPGQSIGVWNFASAAARGPSLLTLGCHVILGCKDQHADTQNNESVRFPKLAMHSEASLQNSHVKNIKLINILTFEDIKADTITKPISKKDLLMTNSPL